MKALTNLNTAAVSGGKAECITVTTKISLNGFSDSCINYLAALAPTLNQALSNEEEEAIEIGFLKNCTPKEIDLYFQRSDEAPYLTVLYK